jgi:transposase
MEHVAIDLGSRESQICVRSTDGTITHEVRYLTARLRGFLRKRPPSRVILETSAEAFRVADVALEAGHEVRIVPATLVRSLGIGARGVKNDRRDAQLLSEVSCRIELPSVHLPSERSRQLKSMCKSRDILITSRTKLVNNVRGWLRTMTIRITGRSPATFPRAVRQKLTELSLEIPSHIERTLTAIEALTEQIKESDQELAQLARNDEVCKRMMSVPGVGVVTAVRYRAALDICGRFGGAHAVQSYLGLTPGESSSGERVLRTGITKAGSAPVRHVLIQAAWSAWRTRPNDPMVQWARRIGERRPKFVAVTALARKIAGILFAIWRDGSTYDPHKGARKVESPDKLLPADVG